MSETAGQHFMRMTRYDNMEPTEERQGLPQPPLELPYEAHLARIPLPKVEEMQPPTVSLHQALDSRRTARRYAAQALRLDELAYLLWSTQGVQRVTSRPSTLRPVPSAGARHAFETYLLVNRVDGLAPGLYRYAAGEHTLLQLDFPADIQEQITAACGGQKQIAGSAVTFLWVVVLERMVYRYGQRGYRYLHLDAGHVCQNLYLAGEALGCRSCAIAAFEDVALNAALRLDGESRFVIYMASLGKRAEESR